MWQVVENKLNEINVKKLGYDYPLCSGILDDSLEPFTTIPNIFLDTFKEPSKKFQLPESTELKYICEKFIQKEKEKRDAIFSKFLDKPEKLQELTNQMLRVLTKCPNYMVIAQINNKEVEIGYLETGCPKSSLNKQIQDHKKLNRFGKDSIDATRLARNKRMSEKLALDYMSIFTINVAGDMIEFRSMCKESGLYKVWLLDQVKIPLNILSAEPKDVYSLIYNLLAFRTAIACTIYKILHATDDTVEVMSTISTSSAMSVDSLTTTIASPSHYSSSSKKRKSRNNKK
ncbi:6384_t:CDS:2 [Racocetra fulgida]|uniref:6384_t:CDS:1 n=1 Tax=Racocetra fulgida TaxID=60492 RepID=A0A9N9DJX4_9GLOM|nr:6384_t:CDS:2 [Racocetra fulgida]